MLADWGIEISKGTICNILNETIDVFVEEFHSAINAVL
jgi:hypothetical protein